jgi:hypothetical protein
MLVFVISYVKDVNKDNVLGTGGALVNTYAHLLKQLWTATGETSVRPTQLKAVIGRFAPQFAGYDQHDSQVRTSTSTSTCAVFSCLPCQSNVLPVLHLGREQTTQEKRSVRCVSGGGARHQLPCTLFA